MNDNLACLFLPLSEKNLLLPSAAVAEIVSYEKPHSLSDVPAWFLGVLTWRGIQIPLANLEQMESHTAWNDTQSVLGNEPNKTEWSEVENKIEENNYRIAVLNRCYKIQEFQNTEKTTKYPFFAILLRRNPKLYRVSTSDVHLIKELEQDIRYKMEIKVFTDRAFVPNLSNLWRIIDALPSRLQWFKQIIL